jgi:hypothetical protein
MQLDMWYGSSELLTNGTLDMDKVAFAFGGEASAGVVVRTQCRRLESSRTSST